MNRLMVAAMAAICGVAAHAAPVDGGMPVSAKVRGHENTEWSTAYAFHLTEAILVALGIDKENVK